MSPVRVLTTLVFTVGLLAGCASQPPAPAKVSEPPVPQTSEPPRERAPVSGPRRMVLNTVEDMLGAPYRYGGNTPRGFDCSGLVQYAHQRAGIPVPRTARDQRYRASSVSLARLQPGDLLFFNLEGTKTSHVGVYVGDGDFIHAPSSGKRVSQSSLENPYWSGNLVSAGSFF